MAKGPRPEIKYGTLISSADAWFVQGAHVSPRYECAHTTDVLTDADGELHRVVPLVLVGEDLGQLYCVSCVIRRQSERIEHLEKQVRALTEIDSARYGVSFPGMTISPGG